MNIELLSNAVRNGICERLAERFSDVYVYKEHITKPKYPNFFIEQLNISAKEERRGYWWLDFGISLRYRECEDNKLAIHLQDKLDTIGLKLMDEMDSVKIADVLMKPINSKYEKKDGALHYFCSIKIQVTKAQDEAVKMQNLELLKTIKGE
jgi:hypothetical protein